MQEMIVPPVKRIESENLDSKFEIVDSVPMRKRSTVVANPGIQRREINI